MFANNSARNYLWTSRWCKEWSGARKLKAASTLDAYNHKCRLHRFWWINSLIYSDMLVNVQLLALWKIKHLYMQQLLISMAITTPTIANFKLPTWSRWTRSWEEMHTTGSCELMWTNCTIPMFRYKCIEWMIIMPDVILNNLCKF